MASSSSSNSASYGKSMKKYYVGESSSSSSLLLSKGKNGDRKGKGKGKVKAKGGGYGKGSDKRKLKCPLPPRHPKTTAAPPQVSRASLSLDMAVEHELLHGRHLDRSMDIKALRRTVSNRVSAQRSRLKRAQYLLDLEKRKQELADKVSSLKPKLEDYTERRRILEIENVSLRTQVSIRAAESRISEDRLEEKRRELMELRKLHEPWTLNLDSEAHMQLSQIRVNVPEVEMNIVPEVEMQVQMAADFEMYVPEAEIMQVSASGPKPYSIEFYQERLMQMEMNQFINQELNNLASALPPPQLDDDLFMELAFEDNDEDEDLEIDQYLNLDEIDLLHPTDV